MTVLLAAFVRWLHLTGGEDKPIKLPEMVNPITGTKTSLSGRNVLGMILAAMVGIIAIATAQNLNSKLSGKLGFIDSTIDPLTAERPAKVENFKRFAS